MAKDLSKGDRVSWNTPQGRTSGKVVDKRTSPFDFADQRFNASDDEPYYLVESDKSGNRAAHKGGALRKLSKRG